MSGLFTGRSNLLQNPGFESGLDFWTADNVTLVDTTPAEGTQAARLSSPVSSLFQDVRLSACSDPLFLSLIAYTQSDETFAGNLVAEVIWLDAARNAIGTGLRAFLTGRTITFDRITYYDVTERPPLAATWARLQLSMNGSEGNALVLDQLLLTQVETPNLVQNPGFERGLQHWESVSFGLQFVDTWEGNAAAESTGAKSILTQDIDIRPHLLQSNYLLSFATESTGGSSLAVQLIWLNSAGNPIGSPGIDNFIVASTLAAQENYLSYLLLSEPAPLGAVRARILFTAESAADSVLRIDQVLLLRMASSNLVQNPGFADNLNHWFLENTTVETGEAYVGNFFAQIAQEGGVLFQTVALPSLSVGHSLLFNFGLRYTGTRFPNGNMLAEIHWLDRSGRELGLGASILVPLFVYQNNLWLVYTTATERAPRGAVAASVQFTKSGGGTGGAIGVDHVLLAVLEQ